MRPFDNAVGARIIPRYSNVRNVILLGEMGESFDEGWPVIGNDLDEGAPATENILEDPVGEGGAGLVAELGIVRYRASTLNKVSEASCRRHVHRVHIHFGEERRRRCDDWRDQDIACLSNLAEMT
ncbi:hypothetical protein HETIRDRAFT_317658 [Heterobasidion irregulare TC 32-1]|uniref:Uncharacterized protein n=1 Tax=Heterobasidion irregulare (strain TC 32-1) TaxID=747525 RepID=W4K890_HETIT|nr:uncharacterized protein HETIRDRAFT_317658 [Heterobasidion irregulare TC 32-1]ETW82047.1 hypothetical protein HETIRDRAFT_317658 [Heterobasidion irregulare TC 32-1]